jgi:hypothetical protein
MKPTKKESPAKKLKEEMENAGNPQVRKWRKWRTKTESSGSIRRFVRCPKNTETDEKTLQADD